LTFQNPKRLENTLKRENQPLQRNNTGTAVVGDELILYVDSKRLKNLIELQQEKLLVDIEKNTKIKLKKLNIQVDNNQQ